jgi:hypothetical protein
MASTLLGGTAGLENAGLGRLEDKPIQGCIVIVQAFIRSLVKQG